MLAGEQAAKEARPLFLCGTINIMWINSYTTWSDDTRRVNLFDGTRNQIKRRNVLPIRRNGCRRIIVDHFNVNPRIVDYSTVVFNHLIQTVCRMDPVVDRGRCAARYNVVLK